MASMNDYKLSCELIGHSLDVRAVAQGPSGEIVSGSRDKTTKIWRREGDAFVESITLRDHTNFVNSVCIVESENWICTGSNDTNICVYKFSSLTPFLTLKGHSGNVCSLAAAGKECSIISGSWDKTAKVWTINDSGFNCVTFEGHEQAVWAVCTLKDGKYATGSADKMIGIWNSLGQKLLVLKGHTDCVRGLLPLPDGRLLSAANDATIRLWSETWECAREFHGHSNYIYTISLVPALGPDVFVTGGEDSTIRLWSAEKGALGDAMEVPAQSVWALVALANGDIVAGCSDAAIRIYTKEKERFAIKEALGAHQMAIETRKAQSRDTLGGVKVNDLPGPEALLNPGKDSQTKMIRQPNGQIMCYQWLEGQWTCLGEVTGASGGSQKTSGKTLFQGKEYDYVFSVDIKDGEPPIKLPYNLGEDPWTVAQKFIHQHDLPQVYLEEVANFIIKNSESTPVIGSGGFADPFTGGNRYVPTVGNNSAPGFGNVDPFTGGSSYISGTAPQRNGFSAPVVPGVNMDPLTGGSSYSTGSQVMLRLFPIKTFHILETYDIEKIGLKLKEFNIRAGEKYTLPIEKIEAVLKLLSTSGALADPEACRTLKTMYTWPSEFLFPVLDITRLLVRDLKMCTLVGNFELLEVAVKNVEPGNPVANKIMATRCLSNMITNEWGRGLFEAKYEMLIDAVKALKNGNVSLQNAIATFYFNISVSQVEVAIEDKSKMLTEAVIEFLIWADQLDAQLRAYQALGNVLTTAYKSYSVALIVSSEDLIEKLKKHAEGQGTEGYDMVKDTAQALLQMLND